jgi:dipeptidyl aminopeptidase/acylaminoacyl peptidase
MRSALFVSGLIVIACAALSSPAAAQGGGGGGTAGGGGGGRGGRGGPPIVMDSARAQRLYVSNKKEDFGLSAAQDARDQAAQAKIDSTFAAHCKGLVDFQQVTYKSPIDGLEIPALLFQPLVKRGAKGHAAMVWVHDGIQGSFRPIMYLPFVLEAVQRGYVIIAPEYRGSVGFGKTLYDAFDYGGKEVDDAIAAYDYLKTLPYVDPDRIGIMGWSHGGSIAAGALFRDGQPFKAGAAIVPVSNLFTRLARSGPSYERSFSETIGGMPHEKVDEYIKRSPVYQAANLKVPILVDVATNDCDVWFTEDQQMVYTLRALKPDLADTKIYVDPPVGPEGCGHTFSRRVDSTTYQRKDTPEQIDSWNRTWTFFDWNLRPYIDPSKPKK